jgi:hypothetical protein
MWLRDTVTPVSPQALGCCSIHYYPQTRELIGKQMAIILDRAQEIDYAKTYHYKSAV